MLDSIFDTDQKILMHLAQSDVRAFDFLYQKYFSKLYGAVYKRLQNRELTEEIVQELFLYGKGEPFYQFLPLLKPIFFLP
jgi:RNA polymerase sigma-70 factor (ECF subfamily)